MRRTSPDECSRRLGSLGHRRGGCSSRTCTLPVGLYEEYGDWLVIQEHSGARFEKCYAREKITATQLIT